MRDFTALEARRVLDGDGHSEGEDDSTENSANRADNVHAETPVLRSLSQKMKLASTKAGKFSSLHDVGKRGVSPQHRNKTVVNSLLAAASAKVLSSGTDSDSESEQIKTKIPAQSSRKSPSTPSSSEHKKGVVLSPESSHRKQTAFSVQRRSLHDWFSSRFDDSSDDEPHRRGILSRQSLTPPAKCAVRPPDIFDGQPQEWSVHRQTQLNGAPFEKDSVHRLSQDTSCDQTMVPLSPSRLVDRASLTHSGSTSATWNCFNHQADSRKELFIITYPSMVEDHDAELKDILHYLNAEEGKAFVADPPISTQGSARAQRLASYLAETGGLDKIYVSPYLRSLQIGQHLGWATNKKLFTEPGLCNAPHTKLSPSTVSGSFMNFPNIDVRYKSCSAYPYPDETIVESVPRMLDVGIDIADRMAPRNRVAVVTHAVSGMAMAAALVSGCERSCSRQDDARLMHLHRLLQRVEPARMCGAYVLRYNAASQAWESDLKCHDFCGQGNDTDNLGPDTRQSEFSTLCATRDWARMWLSACDKRLRHRMRHNLQAASHAASNPRSPADPALWQDKQQDEARRRASSQVVSGLDVLLTRTARACHR